MDTSEHRDQQRRIGASFHRTFSLVCPAVASVLTVIAKREPAESEVGLKELLRRKTDLGTVYIAAMPRYAFCTGLVDQRYHLTEFGRQVVKHDPTLFRKETLWLMHYFLARPHGPAPIYWNRVFCEYLRIGEDVTTSSLTAAILEIGRNTTDDSTKPDFARESAVAFLGTYCRPDAFGPLGILKKTSDGGETRALVQLPPVPPTSALAYALADYWETMFSGRATVNLRELTEPLGFGSLFLLGSGAMAGALSSLQAQRLVEVHRVAPPYQVVRLWGDPTPLLLRIYEPD